MYDVGAGGILSSYAADPMLIIYPINLNGHMISIGSGGVGWDE